MQSEQLLHKYARGWRDGRGVWSKVRAWWWRVRKRAEAEDLRDVEAPAVRRARYQMLRGSGRAARIYRARGVIV